jgi:hypothetical protein
MLNTKTNFPYFREKARNLSKLALDRNKKYIIEIAKVKNT